MNLNYTHRLCGGILHERCVAYFYFYYSVVVIVVVVLVVWFDNFESLMYEPVNCNVSQHRYHHKHTACDVAANNSGQ